MEIAKVVLDLTLTYISVQWEEESEKNNRFLMELESQGQNHKAMKSIETKQGRIKEIDNDILEEFLQYSLTSYTSFDLGNDDTKNYFPNMDTERFYRRKWQNYEKNPDISAAIKKLKDKSHGFDGIIPEFRNVFVQN